MVERVRQTATIEPPRKRAAHALAEESRGRFERPFNKEADPLMDATKRVADTYRAQSSGKFINGFQSFSKPMSNPGSEDGTSNLDLRTDLEEALDQLVIQYIIRYGVPNIPEKNP